MDRQTWMYKISRATHEYIDGVNRFIESAEKNLKKEDRITCPCEDCFNLQKHPSAIVRDHLIRHGFMDNYTKWIWHGEGIHSGKRKTSAENYESTGDSIHNSKEDDTGIDRVEEMIEDIEKILEHQPEILDNLGNDSKKPLYPGCSDHFSKLSTTLRLCKLKVKNGWSDKSFTELLKLLGDILPRNNELPTSTYEAKKILCPLGMTVKKIHACPCDCDVLSSALGRKEHGGRVRRVGGVAKIRDVFGSGKSKHSGLVSLDMATITKEITKKVQKECEEKMNEIMNSKLDGIFNLMKHMGMSLPDVNLVNDISTPRNEIVRSSCHSVDRVDHFSNLQVIYQIYIFSAHW